MFRSIGVVGGGTMGRSIAEMLASKGLEVRLVEKDEEHLAAARAGLEASLERQLERWAITQAEKRLILGRIHLGLEMENLSGCDLVIETVTEDMAVKKRVFARLGELLGQETVIASNTSTLSLTELAGATRHPERVIGMHFVYPTIHAGVVEIIRGLQTSD